MADTTTVDPNEVETERSTDSNGTQTKGASEDNIFDVILETNTYAITTSPSTEPGKPGKPGFGVLKDGNALDKAINAGEVELVFKCALTIPTATSLTGLQKIVPDEDELVLIGNNGIYSKCINRARATLLEQNTEGEFINVDTTELDLQEDAATPMKRKNLSDTAKAYRDIKKLMVNPAAFAEALKLAGYL
jgi:hypothetical protein